MFPKLLLPGTYHEVTFAQQTYFHEVDVTW